MLLLSNKRVVLFALGSITLSYNHLTQLFRRQIALVLSLRTNGADHQHITCGASTHHVRTINTTIEKGENYPYLPPKQILLTTNYLRRRLLIIA